MSGSPPSIQLFPPSDLGVAPVVPPPVAERDPPVLLPIRPTIRGRVLHVVNGEHYSGAERVQDLLAMRLPDEGFTADFAALKSGRFGEVRRSTCRLARTPMRGRFDYRVVGELQKLIRKHDYQLLHAHTPRTAFATAIVARSMQLPWVYHVHSPVSLDSNRQWQVRFNSWIERFSLRSATRVVVVSPSLLPYMQARGIDADRLSCVPNGVPQSDCPRPKRMHRDELVVGMVALFRPRKGTEVLLEAIANVVSCGHRVRLHLVGGFESPQYERQTKSMIEKLGLEDHVELTGFTTDVGTELAMLDVMCLPSLYGEGLPMVVLEAMAAGVPVVASRVEGATSAVTHRESGMLVEPGSVSQLADVLVDFASGEVNHAAMADAALQRHAKQFSDITMARGVADVYRQVLP